MRGTLALALVSAAAATWSVEFFSAEQEIDNYFQPVLRANYLPSAGGSLDVTRIKLCAAVGGREPECVPLDGAEFAGVDLSAHRGSRLEARGWVQGDDGVLSTIARAAIHVRAVAFVSALGGPVQTRDGPCVPFATAFDEGFDPAGRFLWSPHTKCGMPGPLFWYTNVGDTLWELQAWRRCSAQHFWLASLYAAAPAGAPDLVIDVGTSIGQEAIIAARFGYDVVAFEPYAETAATAASNAALNCVSHKIDVVIAGAGATPGRSCSGYGAGSSDRSYADAGIATEEFCSHGLRLTTIDDELAARSEERRPLVLKIDVNGFDSAVIDGCARLLAERPPLVLVFEWLALSPQRHRFDDIAASLQAAGYRLYPLTPIDAAFDAGGAPPHWHNVWDESAPRDRDGNLVPEMTSAVADVDVVALHKDLAGSNFT